MIAVTGFLGAGKTTLIRALLARPEGADTALVVNEFGEVGIDQDLLRASTDSMRLLGNGCVCCSMRSDLQETLRTLFIERAQGRIPAFRRVLIETTGLADPTPILQTFASDRALGDEFHLQALVTVADAVHVAATMARHPEAAKQVALADRIVLTKGDLCDAQGLAQAEAALAAANPLASVAQAVEGELDPGFVFDAVPRGRRPLPLFAEAESHLSGIGTHLLTFERPLDWRALSCAIDTLQTLRGDDLLRVKGFVAVQGRPGPVVVHVVQHLAHRPVELTEWPGEDRRSRLVFITRGIPREALERLIQAGQALLD